MQRAANAYLATQVTTTSPGQVLLMLYDGAIKFLTQAKERMDARDYAGKGNLISKALDILNELSSSLNPEKGGDLADNLGQLYFYCSKRLFQANAKMDQAAVDEVIKILNGLRSAFAQIQDTPEVAAASAQITASRSDPGVGHTAPVSSGVPSGFTPSRGAAAYGRQSAGKVMAGAAAYAGPDNTSAPRPASAVAPVAAPAAGSAALKPDPSRSFGPQETTETPNPPEKNSQVEVFDDELLGVTAPGASAPPSMLGGKRGSAALYRKFMS